MEDQPDFPQPGQSVEALDVVGYWCKGTILKRVEEGQSIGPDPDHFGPGFEVQFDNWTNKTWNRVVPLQQLRRPTDTTTTTLKRSRVTNVRTLRLHADQTRDVSINGVHRTVTISNIDPIRNVVNAVCEDEHLILAVSNFEEQENGNMQTREDSAMMQKKKKKKKFIKDKQRGKKDSAKVQKSEKNVKDNQRSKKVMKGPTENKTSPSVVRNEKPKETCLPMLLGSQGFFEVGDLCSFFETVLLIHMVTVIGDRITVVCGVCEISDRVAIGIESGCEVRARPDLLMPTSVKPSNSLKRVIRELRNGMVISMKDLTLTDPIQCNLLRQLKIGYFLRNICKELLHSRSLRKSVSTVNSVTDFSIFGIAKDSNCAEYTIHNGYAVLDKVMGAKWDVQPCSGHKMSHFNFISSVSVSMSLGMINFIIKKGQSTVPMQDDYRGAVAHKQSVPTTEDHAK